MGQSGAARNAERNRLARARVGLEPGSPAEPKRMAKTQPLHHKSGLQWLLDRGRITTPQYRAGNRYGELFRGVALGHEHSIKSNLDQSIGAAGGSLGDIPLTRIRTAEWIAHCRGEIALARTALGFHGDVQAAVDTICGKGLTIRDLTQEARVADVIEATLGIGLDVLVEHFRGRDGAGRRPSP